MHYSIPPPPGDISETNPVNKFKFNILSQYLLSFSSERVRKGKKVGQRVWYYVYTGMTLRPGTKDVGNHSSILGKKHTQYTHTHRHTCTHAHTG